MLFKYIKNSLKLLITFTFIFSIIGCSSVDETLSNIESRGYEDSSRLVSTEWLADNLDDPQLRIVDCDEPLAYDRMHITGAIKIPVFHYIKNTSVVSPAGYGVNVMTAEEVSALLHKMGIGPNDKVVAYDNSLSLYAARFWWVLRYYGFQFVKIVDGGWKKLYREGRSIGMDVH